MLAAVFPSESICVYVWTGLELNCVYTIGTPTFAVSPSLFTAPGCMLSLYHPITSRVRLNMQLAHHVRSSMWLLRARLRGYKCEHSGVLACALALWLFLHTIIASIPLHFHFTPGRNITGSIQGFDYILKWRGKGRGALGSQELANVQYWEGLQCPRCQDGLSISSIGNWTT